MNLKQQRFCEEYLISGNATQDAIKAGYSEKRHIDNKTSEICQQMDGKHFKMSDFQAGVTAPPFHPWCRTTTVLYFDDEWVVVSEQV